MFFSNKKNCPFPDSSLTVNIYSFVDTERNTVPTTNPKPISSITVNLVPSSKAERSVADAGSRQPSSVDFTGPIYFTLSRNMENPTAVPIITMTAMMIHAGRSRFVGKIRCLCDQKKYASPDQHSPSRDRKISPCCDDRP